MKNVNREIEARFLNVNQKDLIKKLKFLKAKDLGEDLIKELIFYDKKLIWKKKQIFVRLRQTNNKVYLAYKHHQKDTINGTLEVELEVNNLGKTKKFLEELGLISYREQEKKRHKFILGNTILDIDTWPGIPTYLEIEGRSEKDVKDVAKKLGLDFTKAIFIDARGIIETIYNIPVSDYKLFTFKKIK